MSSSYVTALDIIRLTHLNIFATSLNSLHSQHERCPYLKEQKPCFLLSSDGCVTCDNNYDDNIYMWM